MDTPRACSECAADLSGRRASVTFCTPAHKSAFHGRSMKRGLVLVPLMMGHAGARRRSDAVGNQARAEAYRLLDAWNREDAAAGRPPMWSYVERKLLVDRWAAEDLIER